MKLKYVCLGASALSLLATPNAALAEGNDKPGSPYVQCDGQPDNVTDGETAARLIGAITLLGLFAPPHEAPDASKRKFGAEGVAACTSLLSGDHQETNAKRRLGLILGRAIHQIEAKNYQAAIDDVAMGRREAQAAGFMNDGYFVRARGQAFDRVESAALIRMGRADDARATSLRDDGSDQYSLIELLAMPTYDDFLATTSPEEERYDDWRARLAPPLVTVNAERLELSGRFAEAARLRDALEEFSSEASTENKRSSRLLARAAIDHALAGDFAGGAQRAKDSRANADQLRLAGTPESGESELVELLDLYNIIQTAHSGDLKTARRLFAARSEWVTASLGTVMEVNRRLRDGAASDDLIGGLSKTPEQLWKDHVEAARAAMLAKDSDNKSLFMLVPADRSAKVYQPLAKNVWRTDNSKIIIKPKDPSKSRMELMYMPLADPVAAMDAYVLHAALMAKSRGQQGFVFMPVITGRILAAAFRSGNRGDKGLPPELFIDADDVIAKLSPIIPKPAA